MAKDNKAMLEALHPQTKQVICQEMQAVSKDNDKEAVLVASCRRIAVQWQREDYSLPPLQKKRKIYW